MTFARGQFKERTLKHGKLAGWLRLQ